MTYREAHPVGSLGKHIIDTMDAMIAGKTQITHNVNRWQPLSNYGPHTPNPKCWCTASISCFMTYRSGFARINGALITSQHIVTAKHTGMGQIGVSIAVADQNGVIETRTITARNIIAGTDMAILTLNSPLPSNYKPAKLLPANAESYLGMTNRENLPAFLVNRSEGVVTQSLTDGLSHDYVSSPDGQKYSNTGTMEDRYLTWMVTPSLADSGSTLFFIINNEIVLIGCLRSSSQAPAMHHYIPQINAFTYPLTVETVDLSGFIIPSVVVPPPPAPPEDTTVVVGSPIDFNTVEDGQAVLAQTRYARQISVEEPRNTYAAEWQRTHNASKEDTNVVSNVFEEDGRGPCILRLHDYNFNVPVDATVLGLRIRNKDGMSSTSCRISPGDNNSDNFGINNLETLPFTTPVDQLSQSSLWRNWEFGPLSASVVNGLDLSYRQYWEQTGGSPSGVYSADVIGEATVYYTVPSSGGVLDTPPSGQLPGSGESPSGEVPPGETTSQYNVVLTISTGVTPSVISANIVKL